jgi:hypothetical protein
MGRREHALDSRRVVRYTLGVRSTAWAAHERTLRIWDAVVVLWVTIWLVTGVAVGYQIWQLSALARSTVESGQGLGRAGDALQGLGETPVIGERTSKIGEQVSATASSIVASGEQATSSIRGMSLLIGFAVAGIPAGSALAVYLPVRRARRRDAAGVRASLARDGLTPALEAYLARRAVVTLPAADVLKAAADPHGDLMAGRHRALAVAELSRMGFSLNGRP